MVSVIKDLYSMYLYWINRFVLFWAYRELCASFSFGHCVCEETEDPQPWMYYCTVLPGKHPGALGLRAKATT